MPVIFVYYKKEYRTTPESCDSLKVLLSIVSMVLHIVAKLHELKVCRNNFLMGKYEIS